jgi:tetratricopeptide (TPR) repeat protein
MMGGMVLLLLAFLPCGYAAQEPGSNQTPGESPNGPQLQQARALETKAYKTQSLADYQAAAHVLEPFSRQNPSDVTLHRELGALYLDKLNEPELAFPHLQAVYLAQPDQTGWSQMLARAAMETGRPKLQIQILEDVARRDPNDPWCRVELAKALTRAGRYDEAEKRYNEALNAAPDNEWVNLDYAQFLRSRDRPFEAQQIAQRMVTAYQKSAPALTLLGDVYQDNSDFAGAQAAYSEAELAEPGYAGAKAGLSSLQVNREPELKTSGYAFLGNDNFFQSEVYNSLRAPLTDGLFAHALFNAGWFRNSDTGFPHVNRYEEGLGLEYDFNSTLSLEADVSGFEVGDHDIIGGDVGVTWKPTTNFWVYGAYRYHDPVTESIETVADGLTQNVAIVNAGYQYTDYLSATLNTSRADYSDGNLRTFLHVEPANFLVWRRIRLQLGAAYEVIDFEHQTSHYGSPSFYQTFGPVIQVEPNITSWLTFKARYEAAYAAQPGKLGAIVSAGPSAHIGKTIDLNVQYLFYDVPGAYSNYAGNGFQASFTWRF